MSIGVQDGRVALSGLCHIEEAETLFGLLQADQGATVDLAGCLGLHAAVLQVLLVCRARISAPPADPFLKQWILPILTEGNL